jgi:dTDP-4-amino-4,6-dideoxygalactose transaminase
VTERLSSSSVILPLFHQLTRDEQDQVISAMFDAAGLPSPADREPTAVAAG